MASDGILPHDEKSLVEYIKATPTLSNILDNQFDKLEIREVGDGNINFVYVVVGSSGSFVIKQALPYMRCLGESCPLTKERAYFEATALKEHCRLCPDHVPEVFHLDRAMGLIGMRYLEPPRIILRKGLIAGIEYPLLAEHMSGYMAKTLFFTSLLYLTTTDHKRAGSVMVTCDSTQVIDLEFAVYGPMGFDVGAFIGNLIVAYFSQDGHVDQGNDRELYKNWILKTIIETWNLFEHKFLALWDEHKNGRGEAYLPEIYNNTELQQLIKQKYMKELFEDTLGFGAIIMIWDIWSPSLGNGEESSGPLEIRFNEPAKHWTDALPIGNGRLGAMVWGAVKSETLNLNEDTLWTGIPGDYSDPNAPTALAEVRKLVDDGQYAEATAAAAKLSGHPNEVYQLLGDIKLEFDDSHGTYNEKTYQRVLDLETATVKVTYSIGEVDFTREYFASNPDQVVVMKISGNKPGCVSFTVSLQSQLDHHLHVNEKKQIIMEGSCPDKRIPSKVNANDSPKGIQFSAILDVQISGDSGALHVSDEGKLQIDGCNGAVLLLVASSSFDGCFTKPSDSKIDPTSTSMSTLNSIKRYSYSELYERHMDDFQALFNRVSLHISKSTQSVKADESSVPNLNLRGSENKRIPTAERVKSFATDEDPSLVELLFQYGRYLLISCSRPGTQVANLQGIWNKDLEPAWDGAPHLNINLQMNYWPALPCNLQECQEPLFDYISSLSINGSKTAKVNYGASGWVVHHISDIWAKSSPHQGDPTWALWQMGGAWLCTHLWEHYTFTMNRDFLENKAYPLLEGCASFLLDWLIEGHGGYLETNPSTSPEHTFIAPDGKPASVSYSSTMDMSIIREVFAIVVSAAEVLGKNENDLIQRVRKAQPRLLPTKIARDGSIMEWAQDFEDPEVHHRHMSHLFGLYPGHTITVEKNSELCRAARYTLYKRGDDGPGWSTAWKIALWARLHDNESAYRMVKHLFKLVDPDHEIKFEGGLYANMFAAHPPFQIDANFGFSAAVAEMLVQSTMEDVYLLPALPQDKWANGCVKGMKARGAVTISICWKEGDLHEVGIWSNEQPTVRRLHYKGNIIKAKILSGKVYTFNKELKCVRTSSLL